LRNKEAARYARWSAIAAVGIALTVAGVYAQRAIREARARGANPMQVLATIEKQSHEFSFSKMDQERTIFTVRASNATEFKDQNRTILKDVWITIYGRDGSRNDNIHTRECSYDPKSGAILCEGDVQIDIAAANPPAGQGQPAQKQLQITTNHLSFNRDTGEASTPAPVDFHFPQGQGHGIGATYSNINSQVRIEHDVQLTFTQSDRTGGLPVNATGANLEISRVNRTVILGGPAVVKQGDRELSGGKITIELDSEFHAKHAVVEDHPAIHSSEGGGKLSISAHQFEGFLNPDGWLQRIVADGEIAGMRQSAAGTDHFSASRVELAMSPQHNLVENLMATGAVTLDSRQSGDSRSMKTDALRVAFAAVSQPDGKRTDAQDPGKQQIEQRMVESAETLAPGTIETRTGTETTVLRAKKFVTQFGTNGHLEKLLGHSGVEVRRQLGTAAPQTSSSTELVATFDSAGQWDTLDQTGGVRFQQNDRQASAAHARINRSTDMIALDGSPVLTDSQSRTTAAGAAINQKTGEIHATGNVVSTYLSSAQNDAVNLGSGPAHISSQTLSASSTSGHAIYSGHARLWQGESVLDADQIELWRDEKKLVASGHVVAVFPQASGQPGTPATAAPVSAHVTAPGAKKVNASGPTLWTIHAPLLTYRSDQGKAHLEGGVTAQSQQGSLDAPTLDVFLNNSGNTSTAGATTVPGEARGQLNHALARGGVTVHQGDRLGTSEQAEYTASDGRFVLSGGKPTLTDASSDTTTGHSLTFFVANDTILIDSHEGSRTLTKHRVEK
jgi:lipopolysaccharide export system protein LptA